MRIFNTPARQVIPTWKNGEIYSKAFAGLECFRHPAYFQTLIRRLSRNATNRTSRHGILQPLGQPSPPSSGGHKKDPNASNADGSDDLWFVYCTFMSAAIFVDRLLELSGLLLKGARLARMGEVPCRMVVAQRDERKNAK